MNRTPDRAGTTLFCGRRTPRKRRRTPHRENQTPDCVSRTLFCSAWTPHTRRGQLRGRPAAAHRSALCRGNPPVVARSEGQRTPTLNRDARRRDPTRAGTATGPDQCYLMAIHRGSTQARRTLGKRSGERSGVSGRDGERWPCYGSIHVGAIHESPAPAAPPAMPSIATTGAPPAMPSIATIVGDHASRPYGTMVAIGIAAGRRRPCWYRRTNTLHAPCAIEQRRVGANRIRPRRGPRCRRLRPSITPRCRGESHSPASIRNEHAAFATIALQAAQHDDRIAAFAAHDGAHRGRFTNAPTRCCRR